MWLGAIACVLAAAALIVGVVSLNLSRQVQATSTTASEVAQPLAQELFDDDANTQLCRAIGPLMKESDESKRSLQQSGAPGSPERAAVIPEFEGDTLSCAQRLQVVLNEHAKPPRYLTQTLQDYINGMLLYTENIYTDRRARLI